jgi:hypothetical protein
MPVNVFMKVKHELKVKQFSEGYRTEPPLRRYYFKSWLISRLPGLVNYVLDMNPTWLRHEASCDPIPPDVFYHSSISRVTKKKKKYLTCN